jgi:hypothetical protein
MLEDSEDVIALEEELQTVALTTLEKTFNGLIEREIVRDIDARAFVVFVVSTFSIWHVTGRVKSRWLGDPPLDSADGRARSEDFFIDLVETYLLGQAESRSFSALTARDIRLVDELPRQNTTQFARRFCNPEEDPACQHDRLPRRLASRSLLNFSI